MSVETYECSQRSVALAGLVERQAGIFEDLSGLLTEPGFLQRLGQHRELLGKLGVLALKVNVLSELIGLGVKLSELPPEVREIVAVGHSVTVDPLGGQP